MANGMIPARTANYQGQLASANKPPNTIKNKTRLT
jgi:hypothetical protein